MKKFVYLLLALVFTLSACHHVAKSTTVTTKMVAPKVGPKKEICKQVYSKKGLYCGVIIAKCLDDHDRYTQMNIAVAITNPTDDGRAGAEESIQILIEYFHGKPKLLFLGKQTINGMPVFLLRVLKLPKPLPRLPSS